jgi:dephospho-CoA kinase
VSAAASPPPLHIGLTGGIGSGKSTVAARFVALGAALIDTDAISRAIAAPGGAAIPALREAFGEDAIGADGGLNRERMRALAFADPAIKQQLEAVLHPLIGQQAQQHAQAAAQAGKTCLVFDVPLLTESRHWRARVHKVLVVDCEEATQVQRVQSRSGWSAEAVQGAIAAQASRARRRAIADAVIYNEGLSLAALHAQVDTLWARWCA